MLKKPFILKRIILSTLFLSTSTVASPLIIQTKDEWFNNLNKTVPSMVCKTFTGNNFFNLPNIGAAIDYDKCLTLVLPSINACKKHYYGEIPPTLNDESASNWSNMIGQCIGNHFAKTYFTTLLSPPGTIVPTLATDELTKADWLRRASVFAPNIICTAMLRSDSIQAQWLKQNISYRDCIPFIPALFLACQKKLDDKIPNILNSKDQENWGKQLGECVLQNFKTQYLSN